MSPAGTRLFRMGAIAVFCLLAAGALFRWVTLHHTLSDTVSNEVASPRIDVAALRARAESGEAAAQITLGKLYAEGEVVTNDFAAAAIWYAKAAAQGDPAGQLALGELYEAGRGITRDMAEALRLYRLAAEQGYAPAEYTLAFMYEAGRGLPADQKEATRWFQRAAEHGHPLAQYDLGQRYDLGVGTAVDKVEAFKWLAIASGQGQADARTRLEKVRRALRRDQLAEAERRAASYRPKKRS